MALMATGSPRRTADSSACSCGRESFLVSNSQRIRTCVSNNKRGSRRHLLFRSGNFPGNVPEVGRIHVHDVAHDLALACPTVGGRLPDGLLCRAEHRHGAAPLGDGDGLPGLFDLAEAGEAFGLELRCAQYAFLHDSHDNRPYGHLTICLLVGHALACPLSSPASTAPPGVCRHSETCQSLRKPKSPPFLRRAPPACPGRGSFGAARRSSTTGLTDPQL